MRGAVVAVGLLAVDDAVLDEACVLAGAVLLELDVPGAHDGLPGYVLDDWESEGGRWWRALYTVERKKDPVSPRIPHTYTLVRADAKREKRRRRRLEPFGRSSHWPIVQGVKLEIWCRAPSL